MSTSFSNFLSGKSDVMSNLGIFLQLCEIMQTSNETAAGPSTDGVDSTPFQDDELEDEHAIDNGEHPPPPCKEYSLKRYFKEVKKYTKANTPVGMYTFLLRSLISFVTNVHAQLLPNSAVCGLLKTLTTDCHKLIAQHYGKLDDCSEEGHAAVDELSLELVKLIHGVFTRFEGSKVALTNLFFKREWLCGLGENVWRISKDGKTSHRNRRESLNETIQRNMPRLDMFTYVIDFMDIPGKIGELARKTILLALRLGKGDPEFMCYIVKYSGLCEVMVKRLALIFALQLNNVFKVTSSNRVVPARPPRRRIRYSTPMTVTDSRPMISVNAFNSFQCRRRKNTSFRRRKNTPFDANFIRTLKNHSATTDSIHPVFDCLWKYLNDLASVDDERLMPALLIRLTTNFWHPVVRTALRTSSSDDAKAATVFTMEMIRTLTNENLRRTFLEVLMADEEGSGKSQMKSLSSTIQGSRDNDGSDTDGKRKSIDQHSSANYIDDDLPLRVLLIHRMDSDDEELALSTLELLDMILEKMMDLDISM